MLTYETALHHSNENVLLDNTSFDTLRSQDYENLDAQQHVYLDYTGGNLFPKQLILQHQNMLLNNILGNPHSINPSSLKATQLVEEARQKVLSFFNADDYICIFTSNASGALKIVGESYPFNETSNFLLTSDNHNSVNGIRLFCKAKKGTVQYIPMQVENLELDEVFLENALSNAPSSNNNLFAFPAQSNVSGVKHNLNWIAKAQAKGFDVLLDAAAFVPSSPLDLHLYQPNFVSISFYKIFGYPTGIGALLVKKSSFHKLQKPWFAGGTVTIVSVAEQKEFLAQGHERFEDGTINYESIPAVTIGLDFITKIGLPNLQKRVVDCIAYLSTQLLALQHSNGNAIVKIFGPNGFANRGGTIIMNFFDVDGTIFPYYDIEQKASQQNFSIRCGCFCNPGIDEVNSCISTEQMTQYFSSREEFELQDMLQFIGKMRGGTRISVGLASNKADLDAFVQFVAGLKDKVVA
jgi:molybdenum cofactor sulfurtransferase